MGLKNEPIPGEELLALVPAVATATSVLEVAEAEQEAFFSAAEETSSFSQLSSIRFLGGGDLLEARRLPWLLPFVTTSSFFLFLSAVVCLTEAFVEFVTVEGWFSLVKPFDLPLLTRLKKLNMVVFWAATGSELHSSSESSLSL